jgi:APA family basic amino acid/polyamine antiporter
MMPSTGGQYVYLREAYGPMCAFVCGWTFMLAVLSGGSAWLAVTFSIYVRYFVPLTAVMSKVVSIALIAATLLAGLTLSLFPGIIESPLRAVVSSYTFLSGP